MASKVVFLIFLTFPALNSQTIGDKFSFEIPKVFQIGVQSTLFSSAGGGLTTLSTEYYDGENHKGSIVTRDRSGKSQVIFRKLKDQVADTFEIFTIKNDAVCTDFLMVEDELFLVHGTETMTNGYFFTQLLPNMKLSSTSVNMLGIDCYAYGIQNFTNGLGQNLSAFLYWSVKGDWKFPNCPTNGSTCGNWAVPIASRISFPGDNESVEIFNAYYEYKMTIDDPEIFQLPRGVMCEGMAPTNDFPSLTMYFETGIEQSYPDQSAISEKQRLYYNMPDQIVRVDEDVTRDGNVVRTRTILDYKQKVVYKINTETGYCDVVGLADVLEQIFSNHTIAGLDFLVDEAVNSSELFYVGKRSVRETMCDVWVGKSYNGNGVVEIYLTKEAVTNPMDGSISEQYVPLLINESIVVGTTERNTVTRSFFNYNIRIPPWETFDISPCFTDQYRYRFQIELRGPYFGVIDINKNDFVHQVRTQLAQKVGIREIRFQEIMVDHMHGGSTIILLSITLLEDPYNAGHFGTNKGDSATNEKVYLHLAEVILDPLTQKDTFILFETPLNNYPYRAAEIRELTEASLTGGLIESMFFKLDPFAIDSGYDHQIKGQSRMECFELCVNSLGFVCETFSYCKNTGQCSLSTYHVDEPLPPEIILTAQSDCELYSRSYVKDYVRYENTATTDAEIGNSSSSGVNEDDCARQCSVIENSFYCEGFDMCKPPNAKDVVCKFRSRHMGEMASSEIQKSDQCSHYSRNYLDDFLKFKDKAVALKDYVVTITEQSAADCARLCATSADVNACRAFEMCSIASDTDRTICRLIDSSKIMTKSPVLYKSPDCDHYNRERYLPTRHKPSRRTTPQPPVADSTNFGGGSMAGIGIGMLLLGLLIGGAVLIGVMKYKVIQR